MVRTKQSASKDECRKVVESFIYLFIFHNNKKHKKKVTYISFKAIHVYFS